MENAHDAVRLAAGSTLGDLRRWLRPGEARAVEANLAAGGFPADRTAVRRAFRAYGVTLLELLCGLRRSPRDLAARLELSGAQALRPLLDDGAGFILVGLHTGNWEHAAYLARRLGRRLVAPADIQLHPRLHPWLVRHKLQRGIRLLPSGSPPRQLARALAAGDLVGLLFDGGQTGRGVTVRWGAGWMRVAAGPARLSRWSGRPIVPVLAQRTGWMRQALTILPPIPPPTPSRRSGAAGRRAEAACLQALADRFARHLGPGTTPWCIFRPTACYHQCGSSTAAADRASRFA